MDVSQKGESESKRPNKLLSKHLRSSRMFFEFEAEVRNSSFRRRLNQLNIILIMLCHHSDWLLLNSNVIGVLLLWSKHRQSDSVLAIVLLTINQHPHPAWRVSSIQYLAVPFAAEMVHTTSPERIPILNLKSLFLICALALSTSLWLVSLIFLIFPTNKSNSMS